MKSDLEVKLVETIDTNIVSVRENIALRDFDMLLYKAKKLMKQTGAVRNGEPLAIYHSPDFNPRKTDVEVGFPVSTASDHTRTLKFSARWIPDLPPAILALQSNLSGTTSTCFDWAG